MKNKITVKRGTKIISIPLYCTNPKSNSSPQLPEMLKHLKPHKKKKKIHKEFSRRTQRIVPPFFFFSSCKIILLSPNQVHQLSAHALPLTALTTPKQHTMPLCLFSSSQIMPEYNPITRTPNMKKFQQPKSIIHKAQYETTTRINKAQIK